MLGDGRHGFQGGMLLGLGLEFTLKDMVCLLKTFLNVSKPDLSNTGHIFYRVVVDSGCVRRHGLFHGQQRRQHLIIHLNKLQGLFSDFRCGRRHRRHSVSNEPHLVFRENALIIHRGSQYSGIVWDIFPHNDIHHPRKFFCLAEIDVFYFSMGMGTPEHLPVEHAVQGNVIRVFCRTGDLVKGLHIGQSLTDHPELILFGHVASGPLFPIR